MPATISRRLVSLADALAVSTWTVGRYIADGQLDALRLGRKTFRIKVESVEPFIDAGPGRQLAMRRRRVRRGQLWLILVPRMLPEKERDPRKGL